MDAKPLSLGKIVSERQRFVVPIYQRTYEWTVKEQIEGLFDQIEEKDQGASGDRQGGLRALYGCAAAHPG